MNLFIINNVKFNSNLIMSGVVGLELLAPIMLIFKRYRIVGMSLLSIFHLILAPLGFYDFSFLCFTLYLLFIGDLKKSENLVASAGFVSLWITVFTLFILVKSGFAEYHYYIVVTASVLLQLYIVYNIFRQSRAIIKYSFVSSVFSWIVLLALTLHILSPYLGLYTGGTFSMFSNLRTESKYWNHFIISQKVQIFNWQNDLYVFNPSNEQQQFKSKFEPYEPSIITYNHAQLILEEYVQQGVDPPLISNKNGNLNYKKIHAFEKRISNFRSIPTSGQCSW